MGDLSEQNRALVERVEPEYFGWQRAPDAILNRLLDAARTEGRGEGEPVAWQEAAEPFFRLAREVINPVNGERPWHADSKDWMVVFSFAGQSVTLGDLRRAAVASPIREPEISRLPKDAVERLLADHFGWRPYALMASDRSDLRGKIRDGYDYDINEPTRSDLSETADAILNLAPVGGRGEGWRPIETAEPKNSERLMVATADTPPVVGEAWWREDYDGKLDLWWAGEGPGDYHADPIRDRNQRVTHWQPLPPPPEEQEEGSSQSQPVLSPESDNQWLVWSGDDQPVEDGVLVDVRFNRRCGGYGKEADGYPADFWDWSHDGTADPVIIEWRISPPEISAVDGASSRHTGQLRDEPSSSNLNEESQTNGS